jgi:hypothetical protein
MIYYLGAMTRASGSARRSILYLRPDIPDAARGMISKSDSLFG